MIAAHLYSPRRRFWKRARLQISCGYPINVIAMIRAKRAPLREGAERKGRSGTHKAGERVQSLFASQHLVFDYEEIPVANTDASQEFEYQRQRYHAAHTRAVSTWEIKPNIVSIAVMLTEATAPANNAKPTLQSKLANISVAVLVTALRIWSRPVE
jgi:hypothetical protein